MARSDGTTTRPPAPCCCVAVAVVAAGAEGLGAPAVLLPAWLAIGLCVGAACLP